MSIKGHTHAELQFNVTGETIDTLAHLVHFILNACEEEEEGLLVEWLAGDSTVDDPVEVVNDIEYMAKYILTLIDNSVD